MRWLFTLWVVCGSLLSGCEALFDAYREHDMTIIYADADWYIARAEPEQAWFGTLQPNEVPAGPAARTALKYVLITDQGAIPVYAAGAEELLAPFVGDAVQARGKLIDLSDEGYGHELWIATIRRTG